MAPRWFIDESALGLGKLLARVRNDVVFAGHPDMPEIPLGMIDVDDLVDGQLAARA